MITGIDESKTLTKHISCKCKCKFDGRTCNSNQKLKMINVGASVKIQENHCVYKKGFICNPAACILQVLLMIQ